MKRSALLRGALLVMLAARNYFSDNSAGALARAASRQPSPSCP